MSLYRLTLDREFLFLPKEQVYRIMCEIRTGTCSTYTKAKYSNYIVMIMVYFLFNFFTIQALTMISYFISLHQKESILSLLNERH